MKLLAILALIGANKFKGNVLDYSVYNAIEWQTDDTPLITADGSIIEKPIKVKWCAVSMDLFYKYSYGDTITVYDPNNTYTGKWVVRDCMDKRHKRKIDFLVPDSVSLGLGKIIVK